VCFALLQDQGKRMMQQLKCENMQYEDKSIVNFKNTGIRVCFRLVLIAGCIA
jgi:cell fate regulator YaaT (PSP1 superfamily)